MRPEHTLQFRDDFRNNHIPKIYSGYLHLFFNLFVLLGTIIYPLTLVSKPTILELLIVPLVMVLGNILVFIIHKYPLHRYMKISKFAYTIHSKYHHVFYTDKVLIFDGPRDFYILFFPTWVVLGFVLFYHPSLYYLGPQFLTSNSIYLAMASGSAYFLLYEILHFCSHLPENHPVLRIPGVKYMWRHHKDHHDPKLMADYNFNIVFPLTDILMGTKYRGK